DLGNPVLLRGRVSLPGGLGLVTLPRVTLRRVTLPRVVARSLHTTPVRHIAPAPQAAGQAGASPEDMGSVTNVSRRARARTLPRVLGMTTLLDLQPARPAQPAPPKLSLVHSAPLRPRDRERGGRRIFNFIVAVVGLVLTFPLMLLIAALIKLTSRGPVLFTQTRVGLDRRALSNAGATPAATPIRAVRRSRCTSSARCATPTATGSRCGRRPTTCASRRSAACCGSSGSTSCPSCSTC